MDDDDFWSAIMSTNIFFSCWHLINHYLAIALIDFFFQVFEQKMNENIF